MSLIERFQGEQGRRQLIQVLRDQKMVSGSAEIAQRIADMAELRDVPAGTSLIQQDREDNDVFLIVAGAFDIAVNGKKVARRFVNDHVEEMAAIQPTQPRAASVIATEPSVVCKLSAAQLADLGGQYPDIWLAFAKELARRLEQRNAFVNAYRPRRAYSLFPPQRPWILRGQSMTLLSTTISKERSGLTTYFVRHGIPWRAWRRN